MKKLYLLAIFALALILPSCDGNGVDELPKPLRQEIKEMDADLTEASEEDDELEYKGVKVIGDNIIFTVKVLEDARDGKSLKKWAKQNGYDAYDLADLFAGDDEENDEDDEEMYYMLRGYKYNLVLRFIGEDTDDKLEAKVLYKDLSDYDNDEYTAKHKKASSNQNGNKRLLKGLVKGLLIGFLILGGGALFSSRKKSKNDTE